MKSTCNDMKSNATEEIGNGNAEWEALGVAVRKANLEKIPPYSDFEKELMKKRKVRRTPGCIKRWNDGNCKPGKRRPGRNG